MYGVLVWALFEAGIAPALGLAQAGQARIAERLAFLADHVLYGVVVAGLPLAVPRLTGPSILGPLERPYIRSILR
jgi:hypothetical protein